MAEFDPGSFRDPNSRVVLRGSKVYRLLGPRALEDWKAFSASKLFRREVELGRIVDTKEIDIGAVLEEPNPSWVAALEHARLPFLSYPYEWCFSMLRDAALLQLDLLSQALDEDLILKDASPFNIQFRDFRPTFIDIGSFQRLVANQIWEAYGQFCQLFLFPLLLQAHKDVPFQPWLAARLDGIPALEMDNLMSWRDLARPGVFAHVYLQAKLRKRYQRLDSDLESSVRAGKFDKRLIQANVQRLGKLVRKLDWSPAASEWSDYANDNSYPEQDREAKRRFVRESLGDRRRELVWDLGCNTGEYSFIAAEQTDLVVAFDADYLAIERLYRQLRRQKRGSILPLVMNLAQPSPPLGWRHQERAGLEQRPKPDMTLALALVHHLALSANVPLGEFVSFAAALGGELLVEFPTREDAMVKRLLGRKTEQHPDYSRDSFERELGRHFFVRKTLDLLGGHRRLYHAVPRATPS